MEHPLPTPNNPSDLLTAVPKPRTTRSSRERARTRAKGIREQTLKQTLKHTNKARKDTKRRKRELKKLQEFQCHQCRDLHNTEAELLIHANTTGHNLQCNTCDATYPTPSQITQHINANKHRMKCSVCNCLFWKVHEWQNHFGKCKAKRVKIPFVRGPIVLCDELLPRDGFFLRLLVERENRKAKMGGGSTEDQECLPDALLEVEKVEDVEEEEEEESMGM